MSEDRRSEKQVAESEEKKPEQLSDEELKDVTGGMGQWRDQAYKDNKNSGGDHSY